MSRVEIFDQLAGVYDTEVPFFAAFGAQVAARLPAVPAGGAALLDVGAGVGAIAVPAAERGYRVSAVDAAPAMVARLAERLPGALVADAAALPFTDDSFDVVTSGFVLHIVADPVAALAEIRRVLRPGGLLMFTVVGEWPPGFAADDNSGALFAEFTEYLPPGVRRGSDFDAGPDLIAAGFRDVEGGHLTVDLPLAGPESLWRWYLTHGSRRFIDALPPDRRDEFRARVIEDLRGRNRVALRRAAEIWSAKA